MTSLLYYLNINCFSYLINGSCLSWFVRLSLFCSPTEHLINLIFCFTLNQHCLVGIHYYNIMEKLIITTIRDIKYKHKQPSMEEIYYGIKREIDDISMDEFKQVFDEMVNTETIGKLKDRDIYFTIKDLDTTHEEDIIRQVEKYHQHSYINELKSQIDFLKGEIFHKNNIISSLISKISNPSKDLETETRPRNNVVDKREYQQQQQCKQNIVHVLESSEEYKNQINCNKTNISNDKPDKMNIEIIGDSILNGLVDKGLSKDGNSVMVRKYPGSTSRDLKHFAIPSIEKKPSMLIIHAGSNDLTKHVDDTIDNLQFIINKSVRLSPHTKIAISGLIIRKDKKNIENKITELNGAIKKLCDENLLDYISHDNIDVSCLGRKQLHPNRKGNSILAKDFINYIHSTTT